MLPATRAIRTLKIRPLAGEFGRRSPLIQTFSRLPAEFEWLTKGTLHKSCAAKRGRDRPRRGRSDRIRDEWEFRGRLADRRAALADAIERTPVWPSARFPYSRLPLSCPVSRPRLAAGSVGVAGEALGFAREHHPLRSDVHRLAAGPPPFTLSGVGWPIRGPHGRGCQSRNRAPTSNICPKWVGSPAFEARR